MSEPLIRRLAELPSVEPDPARAERVRMRCRARLARRPQAPTALPMLTRRVVTAWQPLIAVLGVAYLAEVLVQAIRLYGAP